MPKAKPTNDEHPFFCHAKGCRKTAWDTPEYLTDEDWAVVRAVVAALRERDRAKFEAALPRETDRTYFHRIVGWPEGLGYYIGGSEGAKEFYFPGFCARDLPLLETALAEHSPLTLFANAEPLEVGCVVE